MSNWIKPLAIILVLFCYAGALPTGSKIGAAVEFIKKPFQKKKPELTEENDCLVNFTHNIETSLRGNDDIFHVVRVTHSDRKKKKKSFECAGTVIRDGTSDVAITAASCFLDDQSEVLQLERVHVFSIDLCRGTDRKVSEAKIVEVYRHLIDSTKFLDIAKVILKDPQPWFLTIKICNETNFFREGNIVGKTVAIDGWACGEKVKEKKLPMDMQEIRMKIINDTKACKKARKAKKSYFGIDGYCAVGTEYAPKVPWGKSRKSAIVRDYLNYKKICEYHGGPVFSLDSEGYPECLVGVANGVLPSKGNWFGRVNWLRTGTVTKKDWYRGITFTSIENIHNKEAYKIIRRHLYHPPKRG